MSEAPAFLQSLDEDQAKAVEHDGGPLAVLAGPGSGKTRVIVHRVARLVAPQSQGGRGADPRSVLALGFTIKSSNEMRDRLEQMAGDDAVRRVEVSTCHSFGKKVLNRHGARLGLPGAWEIMDDALRRRLIRDILRDKEDMQPDLAGGYSRAIDQASDFIRNCHTEALSPQRITSWCQSHQADIESGDVDLEDMDPEAELLRLEEMLLHARVLEQFDAMRMARGLLLFDDFVNLPLKLLEESEEARRLICSEIRHIVVDEFQDWNPAQIRLLGQLASTESEPDVCVVGDDDQSIYAFRGADDRAFERFRKHWPDCTVIPLTTNYRSAPLIISAANHIIEGVTDRFEPDKTVHPPANREPKPGEEVVAVVTKDDANPGQVVGELILREREMFEVPWTEIAVIGRSHKDLLTIASELELMNIPVTRTDLGAPKEDPAVGLLLRWLRVIAWPDQKEHALGLLLSPPVSMSPVAAHALHDQFRRAGQDGADSTFLEWLRQAADSDDKLGRFFELYDRFVDLNATTTVDALMQTIIHEVNLAHYEADTRQAVGWRLTSLVRTLEFARSRLKHLTPLPDARSLIEYVDDLTTRGETPIAPSLERLDGAGDDVGDADGVRFMTAHSSKGLEFDTVILPRVQPGHGYPVSNRSGDADRLPEDLIGRAYGEHHDEERRLFYVACTRAERKLVLLGKKKQKPSLLSHHFFDDLVHRAELGIPLLEEDDVLRDATSHAPEATEDGSDEETAERLMRRIASSAKRELFSLVHDLQRPGVTKQELDALSLRIQEYARNIAIVGHIRARGETPDNLVDGTEASDGIHALLKRLAESGEVEEAVHRLQPPLRLSYTSIRQYDSCPACFYLSQVLGLSLSSSESMQFGSLIHAALEAFYTELRQAEAEGSNPPGKGRLLDLGETFGRQRAGSQLPIDTDLIEQIKAQLSLYWEKLHDPSAEVLELEIKNEFDYVCDGVTHRMTAKIDRIDRDASGRLRIVDYKTGHPSKRLLSPDKSDLQMGIYLLAAQSLYSAPDGLEGQAEYWVTQTGERGVIDFETLSLKSIRNKIDKAIRGILNGEFSRKSNCTGDCRMLGDVTL